MHGNIDLNINEQMSMKSLCDKLVTTA